MLVTALANRPRTEGPARPKPEARPTPPPRLVFIPQAAPGRPVPPPVQARPRTPPPQLELPRPQAPPPIPEPTPKPDRQKDRISIGTEAGERQTQFSPDRATVPGAQRDGRPGLPSPAPPTTPNAQAGSEAIQGTNPQRPSRTSNQGLEPPSGTEERSIAGSIRRLEQRLGSVAAPSGEGGAVRQMGPLFFDPEGADFTAWINHWRNEVYRNWIVPQAVIFGFRSGHVDFEFTVERDGQLSDLRLLKSSGVRALDRAAENALRSSRMLALPGDFRPARVTMQVTFIYNERPQGS